MGTFAFWLFKMDKDKIDDEDDEDETEYCDNCGEDVFDCECELDEDD